jgi:hypothetical protein
VDAALHTLLDHGITPDYVVSVDAQDKFISRFFDVDLGSCEGSGLVYFPVVGSATLRRWRGPRFVAYSANPIYADIAVRFPRSRLWSGGSVIHTAADLAVLLGASTIVFAGADFGFPENRYHAHPEQDRHLKTEVSRLQGDWLTDCRGRKITTIPSYRTYLRDLEGFIRQHRSVEFLRVGAGGAEIQGCSLIRSDASHKGAKRP